MKTVKSSSHSKLTVHFQLNSQTQVSTLTTFVACLLNPMQSGNNLDAEKDAAVTEFISNMVPIYLDT